MQWFSLMAKRRDLFLLLDGKSKQRCKVKTNNMQEYNPYHIKKNELSKKAIFVNFHQCSDIACYN